MPKVNTQIIKREFTPQDILNKSLMVHGPTGTGKSRSTLYFVNLIKEFINVPIVFCPTNQFHNDWTGVVPKCMIREHITLEAIDNIIKIQTEKKKLIELADTYIEFWKKLPGSSEIDAEYEAEIKAINERVARDKLLMTPDDYAKADHEKYAAEFNRNKKSRELIYKKIAKLYRDNGIDRKNIDPANKFASNLFVFHRFFRLNINTLLVIDDCTDQFKAIPDETWKLIFNKSRHFRLTIIMGTHNLGDIKVQCLRTAPFWQVFMTAPAAIGYLTNTSIGLKTVIIVDPNSLSKSFSMDKEKCTMTRVALAREAGIVIKFTYPLNLKFKVGDDILWKFDEHMTKKKISRPVRIDINKI